MKFRNIFFLCLIHLVAESAVKKADMYEIVIHNKSKQDLLLTIIRDEPPSSSVTLLDKVPLIAGTIKSVETPLPGGFVVWLADAETNKDIPVADVVINRSSRSLFVLKNEVDKWVARIYPEPKIIDIFLRGKFNQFTKKYDIFARNKSLEDALIATKRSKKTLPIDLTQQLNVKPNSIEKQILDLAQSKKFEEITKLVNSISDFKIIKDVIAFQLDIAALLVNQFSFDVLESIAEEFPLPKSKELQKIAGIDKYRQIKIKWIYGLLTIKKEIEKVDSVRLPIGPLALIHDCLVELGYLPEEFIPFKTMDEAKKIIAANFKELFERLFIVMGTQVRISPYLDKIKKELGL